MSARARCLKVLFALAALSAAAAPARADGVADVKFLAGGDRQLSGGLDVAYATASGTVAGIGGSAFSNKDYPHAVEGLRASVYQPFDDATYGVRGYATPPDHGSSAYGGTLFTQQNTGEFDDPYQGMWGLNATWLQQTASPFPADAVLADKTFGEGIAEFVSRQNYYNAFHFQITGSYFFYDQPLGPIGDYRTVMLQNDAANLGTLLAIAAPPRWNASVEYGRVVNGGNPGAWQLILGYSRIGLVSGARFLNSYTVGVQFPLPWDGLHSELAYNGVEGNAAAFASYGGLTLTYYWH